MARCSVCANPIAQPSTEEACYLCANHICSKCYVSRMSCARCFTANPILKGEALKLLAWWGLACSDEEQLALAMKFCDLFAATHLLRRPREERHRALRDDVPRLMQAVRDQHVRPPECATLEQFMADPFCLLPIRQ